MVLIILRVIVAQSKEEVVLSRLHELGNVLYHIVFVVRIVWFGLNLLIAQFKKN